MATFAPVRLSGRSGASSAPKISADPWRSVMVTLMPTGISMRSSDSGESFVVLGSGSGATALMVGDGWS